MSNHHSGLDYAIISFAINHYTNDNKRIHTIVKHNIFGDKVDNNIYNYIMNIVDDVSVLSHPSQSAFLCPGFVHYRCRVNKAASVYITNFFFVVSSFYNS